MLSGTLTGGIAGGVIDANYTLQLVGMSVAEGTLTATKLPEPAAALGNVAALAALAAARGFRRTKA